MIHNNSLTCCVSHFPCTYSDFLFVQNFACIGYYFMIFPCVIIITFVVSLFNFTLIFFCFARIRQNIIYKIYFDYTITGFDLFWDEIFRYCTMQFISGYSFILYYFCRTIFCQPLSFFFHIIFSIFNLSLFLFLCKWDPLLIEFILKFLCIKKNL